MRSFLLSCVVLVVASGCASTRTFDAPTSLSEVNQILDDQRAELRLTDGAWLRVYDVQVGPDSTTFFRILPAFGEISRDLTALPTDLVLQIALRSDNGIGTGALVGAVPGGVLVGAGTIGFLGTIGETNTDAQWARFFSAVAVGGGVLISGIGALVGGIAGSAVEPGQRMTVYDWPVAQYLTDTPGEARPPESPQP
jgi:hypothetical protein